MRDPESFAKGVNFEGFLGVFFFGGGGGGEVLVVEERGPKYHNMRANISPQAKSHLNGVLVA